MAAAGKKPHHGTQGQPQGKDTGHNQAGGGAAGQPKGKKNKPAKPAHGAEGQRLSSDGGSGSKSKRYAHRGR